MSHISNNRTAVSLPESPLGLYMALSIGNLQPHRFWNSPHFRFKFFSRSLLMPVKTYQLLSLLTSHPLYYELLQNQPRLPCRIHRPYVSAALSSGERMQAILYHYSMLTSFLDVEAFKSHLSPDGLCLCQFMGKDDQLFILQFVSTCRLDREGEASIILRDGSGQMLAEITFVLCLRDNKRSVIIGGLQGPNNDNAQELVQQATKNLYGLFPKRLVLESLIQVASLLSVDKIFAVSNKLHVYQAVRYKNRVKHLHADYDSFWEMSGGDIDSHGYYSIPINIIRKRLGDVPSKKRAVYRRRYELTDAISEQTRQALTRKCS
ncbi:VirK/YbjX family protein [Serratia plymuthica]|nr:MULTISPECIES: VirK/YbjX family protein [Serratia]EKF62251.1 specificity factor for ClpA-ClpP chaperone-protease complex [Serratia plymuthica A30]AHY09187.1 VirK [Serratia plymuthica]ANK00362.1 hypothetical protein ADP73_21335 [Serratia plymuthica]MBI6137898.1 DUF535 domain-containing protein [Serratia plymuthica]MBL3524560.1 DUF535 domain-containing protein [Serratia plymuthica]